MNLFEGAHKLLKLINFQSFICQYVNSEYNFPEILHTISQFFLAKLLVRGTRGKILGNVKNPGKRKDSGKKVPRKNSANRYGPK